MSETQHPRCIARSIGAVLTVILAGAILSLGTDELLHVAGIFPALGQPMGDTLLLLATAYRTVYNVIGSYIVARLAPHRPMQHALVGGGAGLVLATAGTVATWNSGLGPHWYGAAIIGLAMPCAWAGGGLRVMQLRTRVDAKDEVTAMRRAKLRAKIAFTLARNDRETRFHNNNLRRLVDD
jgi:hypothetical protein